LSTNAAVTVRCSWASGCPHDFAGKRTLAAARRCSIFRQTGRIVGEADALNPIGFAHTQLGEHRQALVSCGRPPPRWLAPSGVQQFRPGLDLSAALGDRHRDADSLIRLGDACQAVNRPGAAGPAGNALPTPGGGTGDLHVTGSLDRPATLCLARLPDRHRRADM
jgi:hypothetical protein